MKKISTPKAELKLIRESFVRIAVFDGVHLEAEDIMAIHQAKLRLLQRPVKHVVLLVSGRYATASKEARELSASDEITFNRVANAIVIHSLAQKLVGNFFIRVNKPKGNTRLFFSEKKAVRWLDGFCDKLAEIPR